MTDESGDPSVPEFLAAALRKKQIDFGEHQKLIRFYRTLASESREAVAVAADPATNFVQGDRAGHQRFQEGESARVPPTASAPPATRIPMAPRRPVVAQPKIVQPPPAPAKEPKRTREVAVAHTATMPAQPSPSENIREQRKQRRLEKRKDRPRWGVQIRKAATTSWDAMANDVAANTMTYLGVLLAIVVIFAFFAFGYFGDVIRIKDLRPVVELAVPLTFFGLAAVLRKRAGSSLAATAVALIGALTIPVMLSASIRDGSLCCPPDLNGPPRWAGYAAVGVISALIYMWLANRERVFAYLVGPVLWAAVGALGLYVTFDISGYQLFLAIVAMGVSLYAASRFGETKWGEILSVPTARMAILSGPVVFVVAVVFAYGDLSTNRDLNLEDLAAPSAAAAWAAVALLAGASVATFAWSGLSEKVSVAIMRGVRGAAYVMAGMAVVFTMGLGISIEWAGLFIVAYGFFVYGLDRRLGGAGSIPLLVSRIAVVGGSVASIADPVVGFVTWTGLAAGAGLYLVSEQFRGILDPLVPEQDAYPVRDWTAWATIIVALGLGAFDVIGGFVGAMILFAAGGICGLSRVSVGKLKPLSTYATVPATALLVLGMALFGRVYETLSVPQQVAAFVMIGLVAAIVRAPWIMRAPVVYVAAVGALGLSLGDARALSLDVAAALTLVIVGAAFVGVSLNPKWRGYSIVNGVIGNLSLYAALGFMADPDARLVALVGLAVLNFIQGAAVERHACALFTVIARRSGRWRGVVLAWPSGIAAISLIPLAMTVATFSNFDDRITATLLLVALGWLYAGSLSFGMLRSRTLGVVLAYASVGYAVVASLPVSWLSTFAAVSGSLTLALIAMAVRKPNWTLPAWMLTIVVVPFAAFSAGTSVGGLNEWVFGWVALILLTVAIVSGRPESGGVSSVWLRPPAAVAMVVLPTVTVFALIDGSGVVILASIAAAVFAFFGFRTRAGAVSIPVTAFIVLAYAQSVSSRLSLVEDPVGWLPLIAIFGSAAVLLPGRGRWRVLTDPSPGVLGAAYSVAGIALLTSPGTGSLPAMLLVWAALLMFTRIMFNVMWVRYAALTTLFLAGVVAGDGWTAGSVLVIAALLGAWANEFEGIIGAVHRWLATLYAFLGIALVGVWRHWTPESIVLVALMSGGAIGMLSLYLDLRTRSRPLLRNWWIPTAVAGQAALVIAVAASTEIDPEAVPGVLLVVFVIEAVITAIYAVVRTDARFAAAAVLSSGAAYGALSIWLPWSDAASIVVTLAVGMGLVVGAATIHLNPQQKKALIWWRPMAAAGQAGMWVAVGLSVVVGLDWVLLAATALTAESVLAGVYVEKRGWEAAAWLAVMSGLGAVGAFGEVAGSSADTFVVAGFVTGVVLAGTSAVLDLFRDGARSRIWWRPMAVIGQLGMWAAVALGTGETVITVERVDWVLLVAIALVVESLIAGAYVERRTWEAGAWVSVLAGLAAVGTLGEVAGASVDGFVVAGFVIGMVLTGSGLTLDLFRGGERSKMWWLPVGVTGQLTLALSVGLALGMWTFSDAMLIATGVALIEAAVLGLYAINKERKEFAWASTIAIGVAMGSSFVGLDLTDTAMATISLVFGSLVLVAWTFFMRGNEASPRLMMWLWPGFVLAEFSLAFGGAVLFDAAPQPTGSFAVAVVLALNGVAIGSVATVRRLQSLAIVSVAFGAAAYGVFLYAFEPAAATATLGIWIGTAVSGLGAAWLGRRDGDVSRIWAIAVVSMTPVGIVGMVAQAAGIGGDSTLVGFAAASLTSSAIIWMNQLTVGAALTDDRESQRRESQILAAVLLVFGMGLLAFWYPEAPLSLAPLLGTAALGIVGARVWSTDEANSSALIAWIGLALVAQAGVIRVFDAASAQSSAMLAVNSVGFLAVGVLGVRRRFALVGVIGLMGALALLVNDVFDLATHAIVVLVAVAVLVVLESERFLRKQEEREYTDAFRIVEWTAICVPLALAAVEMLSDLNFGLLLIAEGVVLVIWGFESRIKRRALVGVLGVVAAVTIGVVIPLVSGAREGFGSGGWLIAGAVMAVLLIAAGSNISRYRASFGHQLDRLGSKLEDWE